MSKQAPVDNTTDEEKSDNTVADEEKAPNLPDQDVDEEEKPEEPQDQELSQWSSQDSEITYKRYKDSSAEADKWRKQVEDNQKTHDDFQKQIATELQDAYEKDPETVGKLFGIPQKQNEGEEEAKPELDQGAFRDEVSASVRADIEVGNFYEKHQDRVGTTEDWEAIKDLAKGFLGKKDNNNNPYTINSALMGATLLRHPGSIGDKAVSEYLSAEANRDSAAMPGDTPASSSENDTDLTDEEMELMRKMKVSKKIIKGVKERKAQRLKK